MVSTPNIGGLPTRDDFGVVGGYIPKQACGVSKKLYVKKKL